MLSEQDISETESFSSQGITEQNEGGSINEISL